jgi:hypothetical protein
MSDSRSGNTVCVNPSAPAGPTVVLAAARRCGELEARGDAGSLLEAARGYEDLIAAAHVGQARVLSRLTVVESAAFAPGAVFPGDGVPLGREVVTPQEIATVLEMSVESVRTRLAVSETLAVLPTVCAAAEAGLLRWWQVRRTVEAAWRLPLATQAALDTHLAALAEAGRLRGGFAATLNRVVLDLDPELAERSLADALAERAVTIRPDQDVPGMGRVGATVPAEGAITVAAGLDRLADTALAPPPPGLPAEGRTADNRRADALVGLLACALDALDANTDADTEITAAAGVVVGDAIRTAAVAVSAEGSGAPRPARRGRHRSPRVALTMSVETLLGVREHAAQVDGWGPITASHARRLAVSEGATWRRILTDPVSGSVLDVGRTRYTPTAAITDHVLTRDGGRCTRPGCSHQARDLDHAEAWDDGGTTDVANLHAVCRGCHTAKHRRGTGNPWSVVIDRGQAIIWHTPHGHEARTLLPDLRPADRMPPPPEPTQRWHDELRWQFRAAAAAVKNRPPQTPPPPHHRFDDPPPF